MRFFRSQRIRKQSVFESFKTKGTSANCTAFSLRFMKIEQEDVEVKRPMLGMITSRKAGNAVERNWCKRRLREVFRKHQLSLDQSAGYLLIVRKSMYAKPFSEIEKDFQYCLHKLCKHAR